MFAQAARGQKLTGFMSYLNSTPKQHSSVTDALNMDDLVDLYEHTAKR